MPHLFTLIQWVIIHLTNLSDFPIILPIHVLTHQGFQWKNWWELLCLLVILFEDFRTILVLCRAECKRRLVRVAIILFWWEFALLFRWWRLLFVYFSNRRPILCKRRERLDKLVILPLNRIPHLEQRLQLILIGILGRLFLLQINRIDKHFGVVHAAPSH